MRRLAVCAAFLVLVVGGAKLAADEPPKPKSEPAKDKPVKFVARVTAEDNGKVKKITLHGEGLPKDGIDLKTDIGAFKKKLEELVTKNKGNQLALQLEIGAKLLQSFVVDLVDAALHAGLKDVSPVPLDPKRD